MVLSELKWLALLLVLEELSPFASGCVLLLNGWTPVPVKDRAKLADIVLSGKVMQTFKNVRTSAKTYSAEIEVIHVYKGEKLLEQLSSKQVFNVSNFGDKPACYADVFKGEQYMFFLTLFEKRLSAKYDDIFGATAEFTTENEEEVLAAQGWDSWSSWTSCSQTCGGGQRSRQRACLLDDGECEGNGREEQACNIFNCHSVKNLLEIFEARKLTPSVQNRPGAYVIYSGATLQSPTRDVFPKTFPVDFSILMSLNLSPDFNGYVFTVSDSSKNLKIGVHYVSGKWRFEYYDQDGLPGVASPVFEAALADSQWHSISFGVRGQEISMFYDCKNKTNKSFPRTRWPHVTLDSTMTIGPIDIAEGSSKEIKLEQFLISEDPRLASLQCSTDLSGDQDHHQMDGESDEVTSVTIATTRHAKPRNSDKSGRLYDWSEWSACSVSCGRGLQTRTLFCRNNQVDPSICIPQHIPRFQARRCYLGECPVVPCYPGCYNGGRCIGQSLCECPAGYTGRHCETAVCERPCQNGGFCVSPGQCSCPYGYLAPDCAPFCQSQCLNGGTCVGADRCVCPPGFAGHTCERVVCDGGCLNGGQCVGANQCACRHGYTGPRCERAVCNPPCQNGGVCGAPYQCLCKPGTIGWYCEHFTCTKRCKNGGVCSGPNKCSCPPGFRGSRCQKRACRGGCLNGGRCIKNRKCRCLPGFSGKRCQKKKCQVQSRLEPYVKSYLRAVREHYASRCGLWHHQPCIKTRIKYVTVSREIFRAVFRCV